MGILPHIKHVSQPVPETIYGYVSAQSQGGVPVTEAEDIDRQSPKAFHAAPSALDRAKEQAERAGLSVIAESRLGFAVSGPKEAYEELTGGRIEPFEALQRVQGGRARYVTHLDIVGEGQPEEPGVGATGSGSPIEAVVLDQPRTPMRLSPTAQPPNVAKYHLRLPGDVAMLLGASLAHRQGQVGGGVRVAMVDTGQYAHTYFMLHDYQVEPTVAVVPGTNPAEDPVGHGTGESANIFAVAPGAVLFPYRASSTNGLLTSAMPGFLRAKQDRPQIITNSWGGDLPYPPHGPLPAAFRPWAAEILDAVEQGIVVVFSAGNGHFSTEPQVPGVIAAGGVFAGPELELRASDYASGYASPWFPDVIVPTVSGLVGMMPRAQYLMLPIPPGCEIDISESQASDGEFPDPPDGTLRDDGWALFSGTSAAAPQIAGAAAVLLGFRPELTPEQVTEALCMTATDITSGHNSPRFNAQARPGRDEATGYGLVNVGAALAYVRDRF
ncbi:S8 family serine peptidase [Streptomyces sp. NPDC001480]|uniref:S8 family serine peptidase n=1 Tax=Streptomyces sp. NPDC001480 TaxID=3364577 RepID=UPI00367D6DA1